VAWLLIFACAVSGASAWAQTPQSTAESGTASTSSPSTKQKSESEAKDLTKASIEDLMNIQVTSASKKEQKLSRVAAAIFVITPEDIRRSGATNIPDLLRMVPGLDVGQMNGSTWAIGARGFNDQFSDKLLVTIDGRIVYTPNFAGVYWDMVDLPLEDIDRIEVIRGPGGSIWGANAVNGVISIFTKRAADSQGGMVEATGGSLVQGAGTVEYGGTAGKDTDFRVFTKYFNDGPEEDFTGQNGDDGWHMLRAGFRTDSTVSPKDSLTFEGNLYTAREGELGYFLPSITSPGLIPVAEEISYGGGFVQSSWKHQCSDHSDSELQVSFTRYTRDDPLEPETRDTLYADYQHHFAWGARQDIILGGGYYFTADNIPGSLTVSFNPQSKTLQVFNFFVQDEIALVPDRVYLTAGTKVEQNTYTGWGWMPSIRATWEASPQHMFWTAVSRALRTPSRNDTNLVVGLGGFTGPNGVPVFEQFIGNPNYQNEELLAYEAGYRTTFSKNVSLDLAAYYNDYNQLQSIEPSVSFFQPTPAPPHEVDTLTFENLLYGETHGFEAAGKWKVSNRWEISPGFAFEAIHLHKDPTSQSVVSVPYYQGNVPERMAQLRSHVELAKRWSWDASTYYVDPLRDQGPSVNARIPAYTRVDSNIMWKVGERFAVSIVGQNLAQDHHLEFDDVFGSLQSGEIKRSGYLKLTWQF
jgi:iron complex outermembrane recepter protein